MSSLNTLTPTETTTIKYYDKNAQTWAEKHGLVNPQPFFTPEMNKLFNLIPSGKILEIGTGHGGDAIQLISHYGVKNYVGIDASQGLLKLPCPVILPPI